MGRKRKKAQPNWTIEITDKESSISVPLKKVTSVSTQSRMIHFDEMPDGSWRMIYNPGLLVDFNFENLNIKLIKGE